MHGQMMDMPLTLATVMEHALLYHPGREIITATGPTERHRSTYADVFERARRLASALSELGCRADDRIATLAWNDYRHLELYYALTCGGFVLHTINPRLFREQIVFIINHADDQWVFVDPQFVPLVEALQHECTGVKGFIILCAADEMPETSLRNAHCYEDLVTAGAAGTPWPVLDEQAACALCYTSGTTGNPKGTLYSHRSLVLHSMITSAADASGFSLHDVVMPIVPMFHVFAWGVPFRGPMTGPKLVFPGRYLGSGEVLHSLITGQNVTFAIGVPTIWQLLLDYLDQHKLDTGPLRTAIVGGAASPLSLFERLKDDYGVELLQGWGMTELSSIGTVNLPGPDYAKLSGEEKRAFPLKQGRPIFGLRLKITDDDGKALPWDGKAAGHLKVRGPAVGAGYFKQQDTGLDDEGWFITGDVATILPDGTMQITDRSKDLIKSGGEWISSIDLENCAMTHPDIKEAAVIGVRHEKWDERPLLIVVAAPGRSPDRDDILACFDGKVASWWKPDDVAFVDALPMTATGKISKLTLREQFSDHLLK
ncbi:MAG: long-chain fatty acid--CoA ligase [Gammaproteobacteria bacterium]|nr:long-chain fatty acid--CoA ligase [Gammaproteobacteria bacterium]NNM01720.1 long-chain fatty acid--CoA ligase [Gammaproteobacteria bacterium]